MPVQRTEAEAIKAAIAFTATLPLRDCVVQSLKSEGSNWTVMVEGLLGVEHEPPSDEDRKTW
jgi:hypothetical protein